MTMDSILGGYGEDTTALWDQEQQDLKNNPVYGPQPPAGLSGPQQGQSLQGIASGLLGGASNAVSGIASALTPNYIEQAATNQQQQYGSGPAGWMNYYNQDIPGVSPFIRENVQPVAGDIGAAIASGPNLFGFGMPNPGAQDIGRFAGENIVPVSAGDFALNAAFAGGPFEAVTGLPLDDLARGVFRTGAEAFRAGMPEPSMFPGLGAGVPPPQDFTPANFSIDDLARQGPSPIDFQQAQMGPAGRIESQAELDSRALQSQMADQFPQPSGANPALPNPVDTVSQSVPLTDRELMQQYMDTARGGGPTSAPMVEASPVSPPPASLVPPPAQLAELEDELGSLANKRMSLFTGLGAMQRLEKAGFDVTAPQAALDAWKADRTVDKWDAFLNSVELHGSQYDIERGDWGLPVNPSLPPASPNLQNPTPEQFTAAVEQAKRDVGVPDSIDQAARDAYIAHTPDEQANLDWVNTPGQQRHTITGEPPPDISSLDAAQTQRQSGIIPSETGGIQQPTANPAGLTQSAQASSAATAQAQRASGALPSSGGTNLSRNSNGAVPPTNTIVQQAASGGFPAPVQNALDKWLDYNIVLVDGYNPSQIGRLYAHADAAFSSKPQDSYIALLTDRLNALEQRLDAAKATPAQRGAAIEQGIRADATRHFPNDPAKVQETVDTMAANAKRGQEIEKDIKLYSDFSGRLRNSVLADLGVFGYQVLAALRHGGLPTALGAVNHIASAAHIPGFVNIAATAGENRTAALLNMGLNLRPEGSVQKQGVGTILRYAGPGIGTLDKYAITPVIDALDKAQFSGVMGLLKQMDAEGRLLIAKTAGQDIANPSINNAIMRAVNNDTSSARGALTPGRKVLEREVLLSPSITRSMAGRMSDMAKIVTGNETEKVIAATSILSYALFAAGLGKLVNDQIGIAGYDPIKGQITLPITDSNGKHHVISVMPGNMLEKTINQTADILMNQSGNRTLDELPAIWGKAAVSRLNLLPSTALRAGGVGYGDNGQFFWGDMPTDQRIQGSIPAPLAVKNTILSGQNDPFSVGASSLGFNEFPEGMNTEAYRERQDAGQVRNQALVNGDTLKSAFTNNPELVPILQGREWSALTTAEKDAITATLSPDQLQQVKEADIASAQANKEKPTAIGNAIDIRAHTKQAEDTVRADYSTQMKTLESALFDGKHDPYLTRLAITEAEKQMNKDLAIERWKGGTTYTGLKWPESSNPDRPSSSIQDAISTWYSLGDHLPKTSTGSINFDALNTLKATYLTELKKDDPATFARLNFYVQQQEAESDSKKPEVLKFFDEIQGTSLRGYYANPEGQHTQWARENPVDNAKLWVAGYIPYLYTPTAVAIASELAPNRQPALRR